MTNFEFKLLQLMQQIEAHLAALVAQGVEASANGTVAPEAESLTTCDDRQERERIPYLGTYEEAHREAARAFAGGFLRGGAFSAYDQINAAMKLTRKCECGWADRCGFPSGQCPVERAETFEAPSRMAMRVMVAPLPLPDLKAEPYDVISRGPGMKDVRRRR